MNAKIRHLKFRAGVLFVLAGAALAITLVGPSSVEAAKTYLNFAGSRPGGGWFYMAGGISPILTREIKDLNVVAESTQGDVENVRRMGKGDLDMAIVHAPTMAEAYNAVRSFKGKKAAKHVRVLAKFYDSPFTVITLRSSGIKSYKDLAGKTVAGGPAGSGSIKNFKMALSIFGLLDKVKIKYMTYADESSALLDKHLDAAAQNGVTAWTVSLDAQRPIRLLSMSQDQANLFVKTYPGYWVTKFNGGKFYRTVKEPSLTVGNTVFMVAHKRVSNKMAYDIVKVLFTPKVKKVLPKIHKLLKGLDNGVVESRKAGIPMHPGAGRFWKEKGIN